MLPLPRLEHKVSVYDYAFHTDTNLIRGAAQPVPRESAVARPPSREDERRFPKRCDGRRAPDGFTSNAVEIRGVNVEPSESPQF